MCYGWFCDEDGTVSPLISEGLDAGRRAADVIDRAYAESLISSGADYLSDQVQEDGSFLYGLFPRFDTTIEGYNIVRHAGTLWSLVCRYRMNRDPDLKDRIGQLIHYMISQIIYDDSGAAYLIDADRQAYCLLPYRSQSDGAYAIEGNQRYVFFSGKDAPQQERAFVDEYNMTCDKDEEHNLIYVVFSPNEFTKAVDRASNSEILPRQLSYKELQEWLAKYRKYDKEMNVQSFPMIIKMK